jgi:hypothetical protein
MTTVAYNSTTGQRYLTSDGKLGTGCPTVGECDACSEPAQAPLTVRVTVDGITNDFCDDCDDLNGEFVVTRDTSVGGPSCTWRSDVVTELCSADVTPFEVRWELVLVDLGGGAINLVVNLIAASDSAVIGQAWDSSETGFDDCHLWEAFPLTWTGPPHSSNSCDRSASTVILNAPLQQAVYYYPAEGAAGLRDLYGPLWFWETAGGVGTPLNRHIRQTKRVQSRSFGVGDALECRIHAIGLPGGKGCHCPRLKRQMNRLSPEVVRKGLDKWTDRVMDSASNKYRALRAIKSLAKWEIRRMIDGACEDVIKWRSR